MLRTLTTVALITTGLAACAPYGPMAVSPRDAREFDQALAGKVAGPSQSCLPTFRTSNFITARNGALVFRDGATTYVTQTGGGCDRLTDSGYTLVTENFGGSLCRGSLARVVDLRTQVIAGSCVIGDFTPFRRP